MWSHSHTFIYWFSDILTFGLGYVCSVLLLYLFSVYFAIQTWEGITETIFDCFVLYLLRIGLHKTVILIKSIKELFEISPEPLLTTV